MGIGSIKSRNRRQKVHFFNTLQDPRLIQKIFVGQNDAVHGGLWLCRSRRFEQGLPNPFGLGFSRERGRGLDF